MACFQQFVGQLFVAGRLELVRHFFGNEKVESLYEGRSVVEFHGGLFQGCSLLEKEKPNWPKAWKLSWRGLSDRPMPKLYRSPRAILQDSAPSAPRR